MQQASAVWKPRTALAAYRALLRAQRDLFVNDSAALTSAHAETRAAFLAQADAQPADVPALVEDAFEASQFIRQNVAQAKLNERGNYGTYAYGSVCQCKSDDAGIFHAFRVEANSLVRRALAIRRSS